MGDSTGARSDRRVMMQPNDPMSLQCVGIADPCLEEVLLSGEIGEEFLTSCMDNITCINEEAGLHTCDVPCVLLAGGSGSNSNAAIIAGSVVGAVAGSACLLAILAAGG